MTVHIMLDLETWGTDPGDDLRSIGACVFDPYTGDVPRHFDEQSWSGPTFYHAVENPVIHGRPWNIGTSVIHPHKRKYPLTRNPETVAWWADQSAEAQAAFADPVDLATALRKFTDWLVNTLPAPMTQADYDGPLDIRLWSHGENMDEPMLRTAYKACGIVYGFGKRQQNAPWHYRSPRDTRTMFEAAGMDPVKCIEPYTVSTGGIYHHALHDAIAQAHAVCEAFRRVNRWHQCWDDEHPEREA